MFEDGALLLDMQGETAGYAYRLYAAAFGRTPDEEGLRFWFDQILSGSVSREEAAEAFVASDEFALLFGDGSSDTVFVEALYGTVLLRSPDQAGYEFWLDAFATGELSRAFMLESFAESDENRARTEPDLENGAWVLPPDDLLA